jgi:hypothetical protein
MAAANSCCDFDRQPLVAKLRIPGIRKAVFTSAGSRSVFQKNQTKQGEEYEY